ncbi:MAG: DUF402 domain-containing protein [Velocimicrobium sp.]
MKTSPELYRKRYVPNELIHLKDDRIIKQVDGLIVTKWNALKPRADISRGISAYFINDGYKISKIYDHQNNLVYWYCDIIKTEYNEAQNSYIFHDLLIDIIIKPDKSLQVLDLDELGDLLSTGKITPLLCSKALKIADILLRQIYENKFEALQNIIEELE